MKTHSLSHCWWPPRLEQRFGYFPTDEFSKPCQWLAVKCSATGLQKVSWTAFFFPPNLHVYPSSPWFLEESNIWYSGQAWRKWLFQLENRLDPNLLFNALVHDQCLILLCVRQCLLIKTKEMLALNFKRSGQQWCVVESIFFYLHVCD